MTNHPSKTKQIAAAALVLLCASSGASAYDPMAGNCFRITSGEEQAEGLPTFLAVSSCSAEDGQSCFLQSGHTIHPDFTGSVQYVPVSRCSNQEEPDSDQDGIPDYEDADNA